MPWTVTFRTSSVRSPTIPRDVLRPQEVEHDGPLAPSTAGEAFMGTKGLALGAYGRKAGMSPYVPGQPAQMWDGRV